MRHDRSWKAATKCFAVGLLVLGLTVALGPVVRANPIPITAVDGIWANAIPPVTINNAVDPRTARWGIPIGGGQSGYNWSPVIPFIAESDGPVFSLGTFNHLNFPILAPTLSSIDLSFSMTIDGLPGLAGAFQFTHNETPNFPPCGFPGAPPCPDVVTILSPFLNTPFSYLGEVYFFTMLGFSQDVGVTPLTQFITNEGQENTASLYGVITETPIGVPEPASLLLLGGGLVGLFSFRKKFRK